MTVTRFVLILMAIAVVVIAVRTLWSLRAADGQRRRR